MKRRLITIPAVDDLEIHYRMGKSYGENAEGEAKFAMPKDLTEPLDLGERFDLKILIPYERYIRNVMITDIRTLWGYDGEPCGRIMQEIKFVITDWHKELLKILPSAK